MDSVMDSELDYQENVDKACKNILESLEEDGVSRVILVGEAGIGKTWLARKICRLATTNEGLCYIALWLNLNKDLDEISLYEDIASQLSLFHGDDEGAEDDSDEDDSEDEEDRKTQHLMRLKDHIHQKLRRKKLKGEGKKYTLLVLDDEGSVTTEKKVMEDFYLANFLAPYRPMKILLTRRKGEEDAVHAHSARKIKSHAHPDQAIESHATDELHAYSDGEIQSNAMSESHLDSQTIDKSQTLCSILTDNSLRGLLNPVIIHELLKLRQSLKISEGGNHNLLSDHIVRLSMRLPAALVILSKSLGYMLHNPSFLLSPYLQEVLKIVHPHSTKSDKAIGCESNTNSRSNENPILRLSYELLQTEDTMTIADCFWHSLSFFELCGCVCYMELIAHWILEGYFDPVRSVTKAYKNGHTIMMELIRRGFLKIQEDNMVMPEVAMKNLIDHRRRGLSGTSQIGLAKVCGSDKTKGLGNINQVDDIMQSVRGTRKRATVTTMLVSGNRLLRETPEIYFKKLGDLEVLGLFEPKVDLFVPFLSKLVKLRVLVIRDCNLLKDIEELKALQGLHVLEVSGASSLKIISDNFFMVMSELQSLHLSGLKIKYSPSSISQLKKLHRLIIKDCPLLEDLPDIQELVNLEVVDVSGAHGLQTCFDKEKENKSKNTTFYQLQQLQLLDLSESQIQRVPIFQDAEVAAELPSLNRLLLRNCKKLIKLPSLKPLSGLQILDLSGTTSLFRMLEVCFEDKKELRVLNLSRTNLRKLPSTIEELSNLSNLLLKDCPNLEALPNIQKLTSLEVFDVSGCTKLHTIEGSFVNMSYLHEVNLSGTKVKTPELPKVSKIHYVKSIILADKRPFKEENWSQVMKAIESEIIEEYSSPDSSQQISEKESGEIGDIQWNFASDCTEKRGVSSKRFLQVPVNGALYKKASSFIDSVSQQEAMKIHKTYDLSGVALANAESVSFVDSSSRTLTSIFNKIKSVKECWLKMCMEIKVLFSGVDEERLGSLETLSVTNLPLLETIKCGGSFKNLKVLSIDCCPNIKTLFAEAIHRPCSLEVLHIKFCEKLEKVFGEEGEEVSTLTTLCLVGLPVLSAVGAKLPNLATFSKRNCPKLHVTTEISEA